MSFKKNKKLNRKTKLLSNADDQKITQQCLDNLIDNIILQQENKMPRSIASNNFYNTSFCITWHHSLRRNPFICGI